MEIKKSTSILLAALILISTVMVGSFSVNAKEGNTTATTPTTEATTATQGSENIIYFVPPKEAVSDSNIYNGYIQVYGSYRPVGVELNNTSKTYQGTPIYSLSLKGYPNVFDITVKIYSNKDLKNPIFSKTIANTTSTANLNNKMYVDGKGLIAYTDDELTPTTTETTEATEVPTKPTEQATTEGKEATPTEATEQTKPTTTEPVATKGQLSKAKVTYAKAVAVNKIKIKFNKVANANNYKIQYKASTTKKWTTYKGKVSGKNTKSCTIGKLTKGKKYNVRVKALSTKKYKAGKYSNVKSVQLLALQLKQGDKVIKTAYKIKLSKAEKKKIKIGKNRCSISVVCDNA